NATINIIRDYNVAEKFVVEVPNVIKGIMKCSKPGCITNKDEPVEPEFVVESKKPITLRCIYCDRVTTAIAENIQ
ncbi:aspartate carbamoyltransferase regulatory subunit, partial [Candidatus Bathyarchaeota archaeon]|nr:aspartate carbamoyltransferase regulatory subunit [Candidatus Bathyarchaeota archaeon]